MNLTTKNSANVTEYVYYLHLNSEKCGVLSNGQLPFIYRHKTASVLMGIWKMNINRNYCVIAYAMPWHSVHSPIPVKGIPEPPLEIAWIARFFFTVSG